MDDMIAAFKSEITLSALDLSPKKATTLSTALTALVLNTS